ncbi:MAG TPA: cation:proton antiporter [Ktedonobacterales bacterium]|nr:cation:proton antiporter [Ktedonobacterales bacterium]
MPLFSLALPNPYLIAAFWIGLTFCASLISIRIGLSVALVEIFMGVLAGNVLGLQTNTWIDFIASFGSVLLTFLAGAEIDPASLRQHLKASLSLGIAAFLAPVLGVFAIAFWVAHWNLHAAEIAGIALSTTSVAVVFAVMIETGLNRTEIGKVILAACFVNDLGTVLALGILFANYNWLLVLFIVATVAALPFLPGLTRLLMRRVGGRVSEPEIKFLFLVLMLLGGLAAVANSEAVLPAYVIGLVVAGVFSHDRALVERMRAIAFAFLTPFFFIKAGLLISVPQLATLAGAGLVVLFFVAKMLTKAVGVRPLTGIFGMSNRTGNYTLMLMSTGLTFGSISALFGLTNHYITSFQYSVLVTVVIMSAVIPTVIAQTFFHPKDAFKHEVTSAEAALMQEEEEAAGALE